MKGQPGIYRAPTRWAYFLEFNRHADADPKTLISQIAQAPRPAVVAFGPTLLGELGSRITVPPLAGFEPVVGPTFRAPASQSELLLWYRDDNYDALFDLARQATLALQDATLTEHTACFDYHESRDLTGFEDGTANPKGDAIVAAAEIPDGQSGAGGSFVLGQKWVHNLAAFNALPVEDQERVIGRTKVDSIELEGDAMPEDSHVSRTDLKIDGVAQKIYRRSMPFGDVATHGLYFFAFACEQSRLQVLLASMFDTARSGVSDRLLNYSSPIGGSYWFAPSAAHLDTLLGA